MQFRNKQAVMVLVLAALMMQGCKTSEGTLENSYKLYGRFTAAQEATVNFTADPFVEDREKEAAAKIMVAAKPIADTLYAAAIETAALQQEIEKMQAAGATVTEDKLLLALQSEAKLRELYMTSRPRLLEALNLIRNLRF